MDEVVLTCHYDGAPNYRVEVEGPDYDSAESAWNACIEAAESAMKAYDGNFSAERV
jgi:translation initiation factor 2 alpha subunit (eIF-2alpha)